MLSNPLTPEWQPRSAMVGRVYVRSVVFLLLLTASGKLIMLFGAAPVLREQSPVLPFLNNRDMLCLAAVLEIASACFALLAGANTRLACLWIVIFASAVFSYRLAAWLSGFQGYCQCLGSFSEALRLSDHQANTIALAVAGYSLVGSSAILLHGGTYWTADGKRPLGGRSATNAPTMPPTYE